MQGEGEVDSVDVGTVGVRSQDARDSSDSRLRHLKVLQLLGQQTHFCGLSQLASSIFSSAT